MSIKLDIDKKRIDIAKEFVSLHKHSDFREWQGHGYSDEDKLITIYFNLIGGVYGEVTVEGKVYNIEISRYDRVDKIPFIYDFEIIEGDY